MEEELRYVLWGEGCEYSAWLLKKYKNQLTQYYINTILIYYIDYR